MNKYRFLILAAVIFSLTVPARASFLDDFQFVIPQTSKNIDTFNINSRITPVNLFTNQQSATTVNNATPGKVNDFNFTFDKDKKNVTLTNLKGEALGLADIERLYGTPDGVKVMVNGEDVFNKYNLRPVGAKLANGDNSWTNSTFTPGTLPIDPASGRFVLQLPSFVNLEHTGGTYGVSSSGESLAVVGNYAYMIDYAKGLYALDISDPTRPTLAGSYNKVANNNRILVKGDYAYLSADSGLYIFNIANPREIKLVSSTPMPGPLAAVDVSSNYVYAADYNQGLQIINISDPEQPKKVSELITPGFTKDIKIVGSYAYVASDTEGNQIINIANPEKPSLTFSSRLNGPAKRVEVLGNYAYITLKGAGLQILDVTDPSHPKGVTTFKTDGDAYNMQIIGKYVFVSTMNNGIQVIDISNPKSPKTVRSFTTNGSAFDIRVNGDYVYVVNTDPSGLQVFHSTFNFTPIDGKTQVNYNYKAE